MHPSHHSRGPITLPVQWPMCTLCRQQYVYQEHPVLGWKVCSYCQWAKSAATPNTRVIGLPSRLPAFSVEFEIQAGWTRYDEVDRALVLLKHGFIRTRDKSVDDEYKSPIYQSRAAFRAALPVLSSLADLVGESCGTHLHVSLPVAERERLYPIHRQIFDSLVTFLEDHKGETERFWGRTFTPYARPLLGDSWSCINLCTRYQTIEFRLPRFRTAEQYLKVVTFCRDVTFFLTKELRSAREPDPAQLGRAVLSLYRRFQPSSY